MMFTLNHLPYDQLASSWTNQHTSLTKIKKKKLQIFFFFLIANLHLVQDTEARTFKTATGPSNITL